MKKEELINTYEAMGISDEKFSAVTADRPQKNTKKSSVMRQYISIAAAIMCMISIVISISMYTMKNSSVAELPTTDREIGETSADTLADKEPESLSGIEYIQEAGLIAPADDYQSLLNIVGMDYQNMSVKAFEENLLVWYEEDRERLARVVRAGVSGAGRTAAAGVLEITKEEELALRLLTGYSLCTLYEAVKAAEEPVFSGTERILENEWTKLRREIKNEEGGTGIFRLNYALSYQITDAETVTVGERDVLLKTMIDEISLWFQDASFEELEQLEKKDVTAKLERIAEKRSNASIMFGIEENEILFAKANKKAD